MQRANLTSLYIPAGILVLLVCLAYVNSTRVPFVFDDMLSIQKDTDVQRGVLFPERWWSLPSRTLLEATFAMNRRFGAEPYGFHAVNIGLHAVNSLFVFVLLGQFGFAAGMPRFFAAGIFALHPLQTESVTYLSGRSELLAAFFILIGLICYLRGGRWNGFGTAAAFLFGLAAKLSIVILPVLLAGIELLRRSKYFRFHFAAAAAAAIATVSLYLDWTFNIGHSLAVWTANQCLVFWYYVAQFFIPRLSVDWGLEQRSAADGLVLAATALMVVLALVTWKIRNFPRAAIGLLFIMSIIPRSVLPMQDLMVEHRMYIPLIGFAMLAALLIEALPRFSVPVVAGVLTVLICLTVIRNDTWASEYSLWKDAVRKSPGNPAAHINLGREFHRSRNFALAVIEYQRAADLAVERIRRHPLNFKNLDLLALAQSNRGSLLLSRKRTDEGERALYASLSLVPYFGPSVLWLSDSWNSQGRFEESVALLDSALLADDFGGGFREKGRLYLNKAEALCARGFVKHADLNFKQAALLDADIPLYVCVEARR